MSNRNYGNFSNRAFSPPRNRQPSTSGSFPGSSSQSFLGDHASQPYFQYQNNSNNAPSQSFSGGGTFQRQSRFSDITPRNRVGFIDYPVQDPNDHPRFNENFNEQPQRFAPRFQNQPQPRPQMQNFPSTSGPVTRNIQNRPRPTAAAVSLPKLKFADIFVARRNDNGITTYNCKLCNLSNLAENNLQTHVIGKRHKHHLRMMETTGKVPGTSTSGNVGKMSQFKPTGDRHYTHRPMFDTVISQVQHPLIALTYTVEILDPALKEPSYVCVLCSKRCDPRTVINHLTSQTHRMNYLERHFPRLITILHNNRRFNEDMEFRQRVLINIAKILEETFGRASAFVYDGSDYEATKEVIFENINRKKHVTQDDIPDEGVLLEGVTLDDSDWDATHPPKAPNITGGGESGARKRRTTQKNINEYRTELRAATVELEHKRADYERDPESHPFYKKEWELFWNRKCDEVTARGGDPKHCDFKDEWCRFFMGRVQDLHREEVKWKTEQLRRKFGLTAGDCENDTSPKRLRCESDIFSDRKGRFNNDYNNESNSDESDDEEYTIDTPRIAKEELYVKEKKIFQNFLGGLKTEKPAQTTTTPTTTLITTLRLLSSLEAELGLLAPRVLDLLSKSLAFERQNVKSSDDLLFDSENLNLVEMVREKILGMQAADLLPSNKAAVAKRAVAEIESLIERHEAMVKVRASLREMGKEDATPEEIEMMMGMLRKKN